MPLLAHRHRPRNTLTVIGQAHRLLAIVYEPLPEWRGNQTFEVEQLCDFFGYDAVFP